MKGLKQTATSAARHSSFSTCQCRSLAQLRACSNDYAVVKDRIIQQFNSRAATYDTGNTFHPLLAQKLVQLCQLKQGQTVLDLACGTGFFAITAAQSAAPDGVVYGIDLTRSMIDVAQAKAEAQSLTNLHWVCGDIEQLSQHLPSHLLGTFDAAACSAAVPFLTKPRETLGDWRRWLKPGARLAFNAFVPPALAGYDLFINIARQVYGLDEVDPAAVLGNPDRVTEALQAAGYKDVQVQREVQERWMPAATPADHAEKVWLMALNNNPFRSADDLLAALGVERLASFQREFVAAVVHDVEAKGRFDASEQRVLNQYDVLHVVATA